MKVEKVDFLEEDEFAIFDNVSDDVFTPKGPVFGHWAFIAMAVVFGLAVVAIISYLCARFICSDRDRREVLADDEVKTVRMAQHLVQSMEQYEITKKQTDAMDSVSQVGELPARDLPDLSQDGLQIVNEYLKNQSDLISVAGSTLKRKPRNYSIRSAQSCGTLPNPHQNLQMAKSGTMERNLGTMERNLGTMERNKMRSHRNITQLSHQAEMARRHTLAGSAGNVSQFSSSGSSATKPHLSCSSAPKPQYVKNKTAQSPAPHYMTPDRRPSAPRYRNNRLSLPPGCVPVIQEEMIPQVDLLESLTAELAKKLIRNSTLSLANVDQSAMRAQNSTLSLANEVRDQSVMDPNGARMVVSANVHSRANLIESGAYYDGDQEMF